MSKRELIKWAPFNSVINGHELLKEIQQEANKFDKPILSEEQISNIEDIIIKSYYEGSTITIKYYKNRNISIIKGVITKLDPIKKIIILNNNLILYFFNIINIFY